MGEVYEADDLETGRRVALKLLSHRLDSPKARRNFLREGRLAASVNHPNSVFVFSTDEIDGVPVISMELMPGGTLEEIVRTQGALNVTQAVDYILQIIDGLEAAYARGILHRDIKPSNCFMDTDGAVKIGDYGLSISSKGSERETFTDKEGFVGTPAYCPPEQVRGDDITICSDIYSVGVTFFYLLTGRTPFIVSDSVRLVAKVLEAPAPPLNTISPGIPLELETAVQRCLEKRQQDRFADYQELRAAIWKFSTLGKRTAEPWRRLLSCTIDLGIVGLLPLVALRVFGDSLPVGIPGFLTHMAILVATVMAVIAWFTLFEWKRGRTPGKALLGLEVQAVISDNPKWVPPLRILGRASIFVMLPLLLALGVLPPLRSESLPPQHFTIYLFDHEFHGINARARYESNLGLSTLVLWMGGACLLCIGMQRRDGWLAIHDRITKTRVLSNSPQSVRHDVASPLCDLTPDDPEMIGPFYILDSLDNSSEWFTGFDPVLLRTIWLRKVPPGTSSVPHAQRNQRRAGRLRWLAGARNADGESWDAYEYPGGQALLGNMGSRASWSQLRLWMKDVADELIISDGDSVSPRLEHIWITSRGRVKLLDFRAPGLDETSPDPQQSGFWSGFAAQLSDNAPKAIPIQEFLAKLPSIHDPGMIARELNILANVPDTVTRSKRLGIVAAGACGPLLLGLFLWSWKSLSPSSALFWTLGTLIFLVALPAMVAAAFTSGGLILRLADVAVVFRDGTPANNFRKAHRSLIAWLPVLVAPVIYAICLTAMNASYAALLTLAVITVIACFSTLLPGRSLQDRLAKTWLVPR
jgi:hypothetical protein